MNSHLASEQTNKKKKQNWQQQARRDVEKPEAEATKLHSNSWLLNVTDSAL